MTFYLLVLLLCSLMRQSTSFIYPIQDKMRPGYQLRYSEGEIFAQNAGPPLLHQGVSFIELDVVITIYAKSNMATTNIELMIYRTDANHKDEDLEGVCRGDIKSLRGNSWADYMVFTKFKSTDAGKARYTDDYLGFENSTYYRHTAMIKKKVYVEKEGWYNVDLVICNVDYQQNPSKLSYLDVVTVPRVQPMSQSPHHQLLLQSPDVHSDATIETTAVENYLARIDGNVKFKNPYGYLPAEFYGLLPFEAARLLAYILIITWYIYIYNKNRDTVLNVHTALLIVFSLALIESAFWTSTYLDINITGEAFCCPYPPLVTTSFVLQVIRQTFARSLLLVVSLGYGIVRPKLLNSEWTAIVIVTILYFFSALAEQIDVIVLGNTRHVNEKQSKSNSLLLIPEFIMDVIFLTWIYFAITSTIRILTQFRQTEKLKIYEHLISIIGIFVVLFSIISIIVILDDSHMIDWPWQLTWMQQAIWELLNFSVLAAIAIVTKPHENSRTLAYSSQLPTDEPTGKKLEMTSHGFGAADHPSDDEDDEQDELSFMEKEYDLVGASRYNKKKEVLPSKSFNGKGRSNSSSSDDGTSNGVKRKSVAKNNASYTDLPDSYDDEEFGIRQD